MRVDRIEVDTHVHSVISGHAWSTLHENVLQAGKVGLRAICLTEHSCAVPGAAPEWAPLSMSMVPKEDEGIHIYHGLELDVISPEGELCPEDRFVKDLDFCLASMHGVACDFNWTRDVCTEAWLRVLDHPRVDALGHIDRAAFPCDMEPIVLKARDCGKLIELNNASMITMRAAGHENVEQLVRLCLRYEVPVCIGSDAHYHTMVGDFSLLGGLLDELDFPEELVVNYTVESFEKFLDRQKQRRLKLTESHGKCLY